MKSSGNPAPRAPNPWIQRNSFAQRNQQSTLRLRNSTAEQTLSSTTATSAVGCLLFETTRSTSLRYITNSLNTLTILVKVSPQIPIVFTLSLEGAQPVGNVWSKTLNPYREMDGSFALLWVVGYARRRHPVRSVDDAGSFLINQIGALAAVDIQRDPTGNNQGLMQITRYTYSLVLNSVRR